jgi:SAM-dependent methyltransferase
MPAGALRLNGLTNPDAWDDPKWLAIHLELETYSIDKHCFNASKEFAYRKGWEFTQTLYGLELLGFISPDARALGVGVGREPVLFYLADRVGRVTGTDLYGNEGWSGNEANPRFLEETARYCPRSFDASRLRLQTMDGTDLKFDSGTFDFVWSLSSIEHFGGHEPARKSIEEMGRVTRPGGIVCVATEFVITPGVPDHPEYFRHPEFESYVLHATPALTPVEPMSYDLPSLEYLIDPIMVNLDGDIHRVRHHIILNDGRYQWTSALVFLRKE